MEEFYEDIAQYIADYRCDDCHDYLWLEYADGHIAYKCLSCDEPSKPILDLSPARYITRYPVPTGPLPDNFEARDKPEKYLGQEDHETKYYRLKHPAAIDSLAIQP